MNEVKKIAREMWWIYVLQGIATLFLGFVALFWPGLTLVTLLYALAIYAIVVGVADLVFSIVSIRSNRSWWVSALAGLALIGIAAFMLRNPGISLVTFAVITGSLFVVRGTLEVIGAALGNTTGERILSFIAGGLGLVAGIIMWAYPVSGSLSFVWVLGLFAIVRGAMDIAKSSSLYQEYKEAEDKKDSNKHSNKDSK